MKIHYSPKLLILLLLRKRSPNETDEEGIISDLELSIRPLPKVEADEISFETSKVRRNAKDPTFRKISVRLALTNLSFPPTNNGNSTVA